MGLVNTKDMLDLAEREGFAIPAFNIHNLETLQAVLKASQAMDSPVILQTTPGTINYAGLEFLVAMARAGADKYRIPVALHLDHCTELSMVFKCIRCGYTSLMVDGSHLPLEENILLVREVVKLTQHLDISVEGELGQLSGIEDDLEVESEHSHLTDPIEAEFFVKATQVDSLAVAIGTAHGFYKTLPKLDYKRLNVLNQQINVPLVLHGASGLSEEQVKKSIQCGIRKVNIATELKEPFAKEILKQLSKNSDVNDPRKYIDPARTAVESVVREKIAICGSNGYGSRLI